MINPQPKKYTWLFLATYDDPKGLPVVLRIQADTEHDARQLLAGDYSLTFAAKIRTDCPVTCHWMDQASPVCWSLIGVAHDPEEMRRHFSGQNHYSGAPVS